MREWWTVGKHNQVYIFGIICILETQEEGQVWMERCWAQLGHVNFEVPAEHPSADAQWALGIGVQKSESGLEIEWERLTQISSIPANLCRKGFVAVWLIKFLWYIKLSLAATNLGQGSQDIHTTTSWDYSNRNPFSAAVCHLASMKPGTRE